MEITKTETGLVCELGACRRRAEYTVEFPELPAAANIAVCGRCLKELADKARKAGVK